MSFQDQINEYISILDCSAKELADASGLSASVLSRYRAGTRSPEKGTEQFERLIHEADEKEGQPDKRSLQKK